MGLDMYLKTNSKKVCKAANKASGSEEWQIPHGTAIYWRKANQIHRWFVENVQYGEDDCGTYGVEVEKLIELRDTCRKVLDASELVDGKVFAGIEYSQEGKRTLYDDGRVIEDPSVAEELLPTESGFFFGSTNYDEWYYDDLERTVKGIDAIMENIEPYKQHSVADLVWDSWREKGEEDEWNVEFTYHASW